MKVLILSASIGSGHTKAAEAVADAFDEQVQIVDFMDKDISLVNFLLKKLYLSMLSLIPDLYDRIYQLAGVRRFGSITRLIWSTLMYLPFTRLLKKYQPDIIICTHPFPEAAASLWKFLHPKSAGKFTLAAILTDYSLHEIWIYNEVDVYFVATEEMKRELETHGKYKVYAFGIPIAKDFYNNQNKNNSLEEAANNNSSFLIHNSSLLIMGGGLGLGSFETTIKALDKIDLPLRITVVTGKNERLMAKLKSTKSKHELILLGFVNNISKLMRESDLLISKPGALTLTESFAVGLPVLLLPPIPGPESLNAEFAVKHGAAISIENADIAVKVYDLINNNERLNAMRKSSKALANEEAAQEIVNTITEICRKE